MWHAGRRVCLPNALYAKLPPHSLPPHSLTDHENDDGNGLSSAIHAAPVPRLRHLQGLVELRSVTAVHVGNVRRDLSPHSRERETARLGSNADGVCSSIFYLLAGLPPLVIWILVGIETMVFAVLALMSLGHLKYLVATRSVALPGEQHPEEWISIGSEKGASTYVRRSRPRVAGLWTVSSSCTGKRNANFVARAREQTRTTE